MDLSAWPAQITLISMIQPSLAITAVVKEHIIKLVNLASVRRIGSGMTPLVLNVTIPNISTLLLNCAWVAPRIRSTTSHSKPAPSVHMTNPNSMDLDACHALHLVIGTLLKRIVLIALVAESMIIRLLIASAIKPTHSSMAKLVLSAIIQNTLISPFSNVWVAPRIKYMTWN